MKLTDLEKNKGLKINSKMSQSDVPARYGTKSVATIDRREQRKRDQALGLVPFAVKLNSELAKRIHDLSQERNIELNELVADLLNKGLSD